jgi:hypothetical protein
MYNPKPTHLRWLLAALVAAMFAACLWPFNFNPTNVVQWLPDEPGVRFAEMGQIVSRETFPPLSRLSADGGLTVEITVRPKKFPRSGIPYILSFCPEKGALPLMIGTWRNSLIVRFGKTGPTAPTKYVEIEIGRASCRERVS